MEVRQSFRHYFNQIQVTSQDTSDRATGWPWRNCIASLIEKDVGSSGAYFFLRNQVYAAVVIAIPLSIHRVPAISCNLNTTITRIIKPLKIQWNIRAGGYFGISNIVDCVANIHAAARGQNKSFMVLFMLQCIKNNQNEKMMIKAGTEGHVARRFKGESRFPGQVWNVFAHVLLMSWFDNWGLVWTNLVQGFSRDSKVSNVFYWTTLYLYNVLRAFLRGGYTQRTGRTDSRGEGSNLQAAAVCLKTASRTAARLLCSRSSCSDSSWRRGAPCPGRPWENAPGWTACSSARQPVSAFPIQISSAMHMCAGLYLLNTYIMEAEEVYSKHKSIIVCFWIHELKTVFFKRNILTHEKNQSEKKKIAETLWASLPFQLLLLMWDPWTY